MMRGGTIITTFIFSVTFLGVTIERNMVIGSLMALIGVTVVGASHLMSSSEDEEMSILQIIGYIAMVVSLFFHGFFFVFEQKLLSKYHLDPLQVVGLKVYSDCYCILL